MSKITSDSMSVAMSEPLSTHRSSDPGGINSPAKSSVPLSEVTLSSVFGPPCTRDDALTDLKKDPETYMKFLTFPQEEQEKVLAFLTELLCRRCHHAAIH